MTRLGVAGLGWLGESLIKELAGVPGLDLLAVQDVLPDRAKDIGALYGADWCGERFEDLLALDDLDAVLICTPNAFHARQAQAALRAGKDVLVQKPLALSHAEAQATISLARQLDRLLFVDYSYRFLETVQTLRHTAAEMGPLRSARAVFHNVYGPGTEKTWFFDPKLSGGGALIDLGVHLLDLGLWLLQPAWVRLEEASLAFVNHGRVEDGGRLLVQLDDVPLAVEVSWNAPQAASEISFELASERETVRWENVEGSFFHFRTQRNNRVLVDRETTLREDTLRAFARGLASRRAPPIDARVYALLDQVYLSHPISGPGARAEPARKQT